MHTCFVAFIAPGRFDGNSRSGLFWNVALYPLGWGFAEYGFGIWRRWDEEAYFMGSFGVLARMGAWRGDGKKWTDRYEIWATGG
jgi:hypothetical protein